MRDTGDVPRRIATDPLFSRSPSAGKCHLYVLPCAWEDIAKLGHSRDPLSRMQALHPRYFEFFDLDRALLIETDTVREARDLELKFGRALKLHNAPAPLVVRRQAAGHTEWYRGAYEELAREGVELSHTGYVFRRGLRPWLHERLLARGDQLYTWAMGVLDQAEPGYDDALPPVARDVLDAYTALNIHLEPLLPDPLWQWYRAQRQ